MVKQNAKLGYSKDLEWQPKNTRTLKKNKTITKTKTKTKAKHDWKENEIIALIAAVKKRPRLWAEEYKIESRKPLEWKELVSELNIEGIGWIEVRKKWSNLLSHNSPDSKWAKHMIFLDSTKTTSSTEADEVELFNASSLKVADNSVCKRSSMLNTSSPPSTPDPNHDVSQPSKCPGIQTLQTSSKVSSSTPCVSSALTGSQDAMQIPDANSTFCDHLLAELRMLSDIESRYLRRLLVQVVYDFGDSLETQLTTV